MQEPVELNGSKPIQVRAFTAIREDFAEELPRLVLVGAEAESIAMRPAPYHPPVSEAPTASDLPAQAPPSGIVARKLNEEKFDGLIDFVRLPGGSFFLLDSKWNLWKWPGDARARELVKKDLHFPELGSSADGEVYLNLSDDNVLLLSVNGGDFRQIRRDSYPKLLGQSCNPHSILFVDDDNTVGTKDDILRLEGDRQEEKVGAVDASGIFDVIEFPKRVLVYTTEEDDAIFRYAEGEAKPWVRKLSQPGILTAYEDRIYCLERGGPRLYRVGLDGKAEAVDLRDTGVCEAPPRDEEARGLRAVGKDAVQIIASRNIFELDLSHARWEPVRWRASRPTSG